MEYAGFWKRTGAFIFDLLIINLIIFWPFQRTLESYASYSLLAEQALPVRIYLIIMIISLLALLYFAFFEYYLGQTVGMMLLNIKAVSLQGRFTLWKAVVRNCFILPFFPFYAMWIVEPIYLAFYKERLLERLTFTQTVSVSPARRYYEEYKLQKV